jgi:hypothetical protein
VHMHRVRPQRHVYRSTGSALAYLVGGLMFVALMVFFALNTVDNSIAVTYFVGAAVVGCWPALRISRCGIYIEDDGVRVVNPIRTVHLRRSEIACFELRSYGACSIKLVRGRSVGIYGIQQTAWDARRGKKVTDEAQMISELNALLESHRASAVAEGARGPG